MAEFWRKASEKSFHMTTVTDHTGRLPQTREIRRKLADFALRWRIASTIVDDADGLIC
jgi:hypothetical protein